MSQEQISRIVELENTIAELNKAHAQEVKEMYDHIFILQGTIIELQNTIIENSNIPMIRTLPDRELDELILEGKLKENGRVKRKKRKSSPVPSNESSRLGKKLEEVYGDNQEDKNDKFF